MKNKSRNKNRKLIIIIVAEVAIMGLVCLTFALLWFGILPLTKDGNTPESVIQSQVVPSPNSISAFPTMYSTAVEQQVTVEANSPIVEPSQAPLSEIPVEEFPFSSMNNVLPDDILEEVAYFSAGGPDGDFQCDHPMIAGDPQDDELMSLNIFSVCGLSGEQDLIGQVNYPDGRIYSQHVQVLSSPNGTLYAELEFMPNINDPIGVYVFSLEGLDGKFESNAYYRKPDGPRLFSLDNNQVFLYGFAPQESVRMFAYYLDNEIWKFSGWNEYVVDQNGQLVVSLLFDGLGSDTDIPALIAVGEKSGEAPLLTTRSSGGRITWAHEKISVGASESQSKYMQCSSEQLSSSNLMSRYNAQAVDSVKIYVNPRLDARTFNEVPANSKVYVFLGPYCTGNQVWWKADAEVGAGYLLEKDDRYYLEPLHLPADFCGGLQSIFTIGDWVMVTFPKTINVNAYELPSFSSSIIYTFVEESGVQIEEGPVCADGTIWWKTWDFFHENSWIPEYQNGIHIFGLYFSP